MKNSQKATGIATLIGLGIGALAFFGYKRLPHDKKEKIKGRLNEAGNKFKETAQNVESSVKDKYNTVKSNVRDEVNTGKGNLREEIKDARH